MKPSDGDVAEVASKRPRLPPAVIALGLTSFFTDAGTEMIFPLLPVFVASLGASTTFLGLVEGLADATSSLLKLASGELADRTGRTKPFVVAGYGIAGAVRPLVALASAPWHVLLVRVGDRVGKGIRSAPRDALLAASVPPEQSGRAFGFHRAMDHAGAVVGPLCATALLALGWELRDVFWAATIPGAVAFAFVLTVPASGTTACLPRSGTSIPLARAPSSPGRLASAVREPPRPGSLAIGQASAAATTDVVRAQAAPQGRQLPPRLRSYLAILALFSLGNSSDAFLLLRAKDLGIATAAIPILWSVFHVSKVLSSLLGGDLADRIPRVKLVLFGWAVFAAAYVGFGLATAAWQVWVLFVIYGAFFGLTEPAEKALVKDLAPVAARGRAYGAYNFVVGLSAIPAGVLTGWLWQEYGPLVALSTGAALAALAAIALAVWQARAPNLAILGNQSH